MWHGMGLCFYSKRELFAFLQIPKVSFIYLIITFITAMVCKILFIIQSSIYYTVSVIDSMI